MKTIGGSGSRANSNNIINEGSELIPIIIPAFCAWIVTRFGVSLEDNCVYMRHYDVITC